MSVTNRGFRLKIIGDSAILVESPNNGTELFVPILSNNRIHLQNVIAQRRCCDQASSSQLGISKRMSIQQQPPLANSTPTKSIRSLREFATPEAARRAKVSDKTTRLSIPGLPSGIKVIRLHRAPTPNTPNKLARIVPLSRTQSPLLSRKYPREPQVLRNLLNVSAFRTPVSPRADDEDVSNDTPSSPNTTFLAGPSNEHGGPGSATKWRKCITPQRTYLRRSNSEKPQVKNQMTVKPLPTIGRQKLDLIRNSTEYPRGDRSVVIKRRKLVIDTNLSITPRTFKKQLRRVTSPKRAEEHLPRTRRQFILSHQTAFDLLTNSSYYPRIATKLNKVFRQGCLNKHAETILKYKQLTLGLPTIENA